MKNSILITAIITTAIFSCKDKEKDQPKPAPTLSAKQTMLIGKDWKIDKIVMEGTDITAFIPACMKDNIMYHFSDAASGYFDEGPTKCETSDPQRENFSWKLDNNETRLITSNTDSKDTFQMLTLSAAEMKLGIDKTEITFKN